MTETLILLSHPDYARSRANRALADAAAALPGVEVAHLEGLYPDGRIDTDAEVARLVAAERIVLQFPVRWYSTPPLLKAWQDAVLTRMFYANPQTKGALIAGRALMVAATAGNTPAAYAAEGANLFPLPELLKPLRSTAKRCGLRWVEPFVAFENTRPPEAKVAADAALYRERLRAFGRGA